MIKAAGNEVKDEVRFIRDVRNRCGSLTGEQADVGKTEKNTANKVGLKEEAGRVGANLFTC